MIEEINVLQYQINSLINESHSIWETIEKMTKKRNELLFDYILENQILSGLDWEFTNSYYLHCRQSHQNVVFLREFLASDKSYELLPDVYLELYNDEVSLYFSNTEDMLFLIERLDLKVSGGRIKKEINELETKLSKLKSVYKRYQKSKLNTEKES